MLTNALCEKLLQSSFKPRCVRSVKEQKNIVLADHPPKIELNQKQLQKSKKGGEIGEKNDFVWI